MEQLLTTARAEVDSTSKELAGEREARVAAEASRSATEEHLACVTQKVRSSPVEGGFTPVRCQSRNLRP